MFSEPPLDGHALSIGNAKADTIATKQAESVTERTRLLDLQSCLDLPWSIM
jgi:hypothetical protein